MQRLAVIGLGSVFQGPYRSRIEQLRQQGKAEIQVVCDRDESKRLWAAERFPAARMSDDALATCVADDVDTVVILTSMVAHGELAAAALRAGKNVLVEKPMATRLDEAAELVELADRGPGLLICAPHVLLSPTYREMHARVNAGFVGPILSARARYGWAGPWWGEWFYRPGGGAMFDLGVYNLTSLCGFMGSVQRVVALSGVAIPQREVNGEMMSVEADDNSHILLDFGDSRFAHIFTGFTIQRYRSPAIELYGATGVLQMLGDDWAPEGFEQWLNERGVWEVEPEVEPNWPWTEGIGHLVDCVERGIQPATSPRQAYHALEVMLAAQESARSGRVVDIASSFPQPDYSNLPSAISDARARHDARST